MGCFDTIENVPMTCPVCLHEWLASLQTKDLDCSLSHYEWGVPHDDFKDVARGRILGCDCCPACADRIRKDTGQKGVLVEAVIELRDNAPAVVLRTIARFSSGDEVLELNKESSARKISEEKP